MRIPLTAKTHGDLASNYYGFTLTSSFYTLLNIWDMRGF